MFDITVTLTPAQYWAALDGKSGSGFIDFDFFFHLVNFTHELKDSDPKTQLENFNLARKWPAKVNHTISPCPVKWRVKKDENEVRSPAFNSRLRDLGALGPRAGLLTRHRCVFLSVKWEVSKTDTLQSDSKFKNSRVILRSDPDVGKAKASYVSLHTSLGFAGWGKSTLHVFPSAAPGICAPGSVLGRESKPGRWGPGWGGSCLVVCASKKHQKPSVSPPPRGTIYHPQLQTPDTYAYTKNVFLY